MAILKENIPSQRFEIIRDRIGEILADELYAQVYKGDSSLECDVYVERNSSIGVEETAVVNVTLSQGRYDSYDIKQQDGEYTYNIDVFASGRSTDSQDGDSISAKSMQRILGACRWILMNPLYITLGYSKPFNCTRRCEEIQIAQIQKQDTCSVSQGRLTFVVKVLESVEYQDILIAEGYDTSVKIAETNKGFKFIAENYPV